MFTPKQIGLIVTAYTGIGCIGMAEFHSFAEEKLGRPIFTHEFADKKVWEALKEEVRADFMRLAEWCCKSEEKNNVQS